MLSAQRWSSPHTVCHCSHSQSADRALDRACLVHRILLPRPLTSAAPHARGTSLAARVVGAVPPRRLARRAFGRRCGRAIRQRRVACLAVADRDRARTGSRTRAGAGAGTRAPRGRLAADVARAREEHSCRERVPPPAHGSSHTTVPRLLSDGGNASRLRASPRIHDACLFNLSPLVLGRRSPNPLGLTKLAPREMPSTLPDHRWIHRPRAL